MPADPFENVLGDGRGSDQPPGPLARMSFHPAGSLFLREDDTVDGALAHMDEFAQNAARVATVTRALVERGWELRVAKVGGGAPWVQLTKHFVSLAAAEAEAVAGGAEDDMLDFFPSGSPQQRQGMEQIRVGASR